MAATKCTLTMEQAIDVRLATEALQASKADQYADEPRRHQAILEFYVTQLLAVIADLTGGAA